jgi:molecular chaperone DnaK
MPLVQQKVKEFFGRIPAKNVHPDEAVAIGASIMGSTLLEEDANIMLLDVTPFSLGIRTAGGFSTILIQKNSTIPTEASHIFTTVTDGQRSVKIQVLQGESKLASENTLLGEFTLTDIPAQKAGEPEIKVTFSIDSNGIVQASARDLKTEKEQSIVVTSKSTLTDEEREAIASQYQPKNDESVAVKT